MAVRAMELLSRGSYVVNIYTSDDCFTAYPALRAIDSDYTTFWRSCAAVPSSGVPVTITLDLSAIPSAKRQSLVLAWYNIATGAYDYTLNSSPVANLPRDYTIQTNTAPGGTGSPPTSGWNTLQTVTSNVFHSRQHTLAFGGANWLRLSFTASNGPGGNNDIQLYGLDVYDASNGLEDNFIMYGDSIVQTGALQDNKGDGTLAQLIQAQQAANFPIIEDGGVGGYTAQDGAEHIASWLPYFPGKYVILAYGTNDANQGGAYLTSYQSNMVAMITAILGAGKVPIIGKIPWGKTTGVQTNAPTLNAIIDGLYSTYPQIIHGPDLWTFFSNNQALIVSNDMHPTDPDGYGAWRQQWANALVTNLYQAPAVSQKLLAFKRRGFIFA